MVSITRGNTNQTAVRITRNAILENGGHQVERNTTNPKTKLPNDVRTQLRAGQRMLDRHMPNPYGIEGIIIIGNKNSRKTR